MGQEGGVPTTPAAQIECAMLYGKYISERAHMSVGWVMCGSLPGSSGCYGSRSLGPVIVNSKLKNTRRTVARNLLGLPFVDRLKKRY